MKGDDGCVEVRPMNPDGDADEILLFINSDKSKTEDMLSKRQFFRNLPNNKTAPVGFVAVYDEKIIGVAIMSDYPPAKELEITSLTPLKNRGVFMLLVDAVITEAEIMNYAEVSIHVRESNEKLKNALEAMLFQVREKEIAFFCNPYENSLVMSYVRSTKVPPSNRIAPILDWLEEERKRRR